MCSCGVKCFGAVFGVFLCVSDMFSISVGFCVCVCVCV